VVGNKGPEKREVKASKEGKTANVKGTTTNSRCEDVSFPGTGREDGRTGKDGLEGGLKAWSVKRKRKKKGRSARYGRRR
jgi:hypothetical protein